MKLTNLEIGQSGYVSHIDSNEKLLKRLNILGCLNGTKVTLKRKAPLGDPIIVEFRGFEIALRKKDAKDIYITED